MDINIGKKDWLFLMLCFGLGLLAEMSFLHGRIGLSYLIFISAFYAVAFFRFRLSFNHRRIGLLFMVVIWILSGSYLLYDHELFYSLNLLIIPVLVFSHIVLITRPNTFKWNTPHFIVFLIETLQEAGKYNSAFWNAVFKKLFKHTNKNTAQHIKQIMVGIAIAIPLLLIITGLLVSTDIMFEDTVMRLPEFSVELNVIEGIFRFVFVIFAGLLFFGVFQVLQKKSSPPQQNSKQTKQKWNRMTAITILVLLNAVYLLFVVTQFTYLFNNELFVDVTYATYAQRGFLELILVTLMNWIILISLLKKVTPSRKRNRLTLNILYSLLIIISVVMLASAYQRLSLYEAAYGFTVARILAHTFMIFLMVIFTYTFIRVWIERISLLHFYLIVGLIFYTLLNIVNVEEIIVDYNIERYKVTEKIDLEYLNTLSYTGLDGLIRLYEMDEHIPGLQAILIKRKQQERKQLKDSWQSFNFVKRKTLIKLDKLDLQ